MKNIKIVFFDVDGTLIDMNSRQITEKTLEALKRLKEKGVILCMATGRAPSTLPDIKELFDVFMTFNGSYCFNKEQTIYSHPLDGEDVKKIIRNAKSIGRPVSIATKERVVANGADEDLIKYYSFANLKVDVDERFESFLEEEIYQVMMGGCKEEYDRIMQDVLQAKITAWWDRAVDIIPRSGGKGKAVEKILEFYHFTKEEALAFGDGHNDIEMLEKAGLGVAMGNASEEVKAYADDVCKNVWEDGIYQYLLANNMI